MKKIYLIPIMVCTILFMFVVNSFAIAPFHPDVVEEYRAKGELYKLTEEYNKLKQEIYNIMGTNTRKAVSSKGNNNVIVIIMNYSNLSVNSISTPTFYKSLFENGPDGNGMSWRKYYLDMSNGKLDLGFDVFGPYTSSLTRESCGGYNYSNVRTLVGEAIDFAHNNGVDFSNYDNDNDGYADCVVIIHAGRGREISHDYDDIHSHRSSIYPPKNYDGVNIQDYSIQPEYRYIPGDSSIGVFVHEFGHLLGLPDLYDTTYSTDGVGMWSTMAAGSYAGPLLSGSTPAPLLAWEKAYLGWSVTIYDITDMGNKGTELSSNSTLKYSDSDIALMLSFGLLSIIGFIVTILTGFKKGTNNIITIFLFIFLFIMPVTMFTYGCLTPKGFKLTINITPENSGTIIKTPNMTYYEDNSEVSIKAEVSNPSYTFSNWEGDITGTNNQQTIIMDSDKTITAVFRKLDENEYAITDIESSRSAIRINLNPEQYYLLENKVIKTGTWTEYLPGSGLLISHIDSRYTPPENPYNDVNDGNAHGVNIKEADGNNELWVQGTPYGEAGDPYQSPKTLTPSTSPNSNLNGSSQNNGGSSGISITNISSAGNIMTFKYTKD